MTTPENTQRLTRDPVISKGLVSPLLNGLQRLLFVKRTEGVEGLPDDLQPVELVAWDVVLKVCDALYAEDTQKLWLVNDTGDLVKTVAAELIGKKSQGQIQRLFGDVVDTTKIKSIAGDVREHVEETILRFVRTDRQAGALSITFDPFADRASLEVKGGEAIYTQPMQLTSLGEFNRREINEVSEDFREHFPEFYDFVRLLCAARFAPDRRQAFLWLNASPGWGKSMLLSALKMLDIVVEISASEAEACFEGKPVGLDPTRLARAWVLAFDEVKGVKSEFKQLTNTIHLSPKFRGRVEVPVYLKMFLSAEGIDSLAGTEGVEAQFADRFSYMRGTGRIEDRELFKELGGRRYVQTLAAAISEYIISYSDDMRGLGREEAARTSESRLKSLHAKYKITNTMAALEDTLTDYAVELKVLLRGLPKSACALPMNLREALQRSCVDGWIGPLEERRSVVVLKKPVTFVKAWLSATVDRSEATKVSYKAKQLCTMVSEGDLDITFRLARRWNDSREATETMKGLVLSKEERSEKNNVRQFLTPPLPLERRFL